jgi:hypothetical protein
MRRVFFFLPPSRAQVHLHARQVLDTGDAHAALADTQAHPHSCAHGIWHLDRKWHVRAIGGGSERECEGERGCPKIDGTPPVDLQTGCTNMDTIILVKTI